MSDSLRKKLCPSLISPVPRRSSQNPISSQKRNPFVELPPLKTPGFAEEELLLKELSLILAKPCTILPPITKKTPSPGFLNKIDRPPTRQKVNPVVFDEKFVELNSSISTCESWTEANKL